MRIPVFPNTKFVENDGFLTNDMLFYTTELNQNLQGALSDNGWTVPQISDTDLVAIEPSMPDGTIWYENVNHVFVGKVNGTLMKFTMAVYP